MTTVPFDTLKLARKLEAAGFQPKQAADTSEALAEVLSEEVATKADIAAVRHDIELLKRDLTIRTGAMMLALGGFLAAIRFFA
jgi:hypothetical protein